MKILLIVYDNGSYIHNFPLGTAYISSYMKKNGYKNVTIYHQDVYHYSEDHLTDYLNKNDFDIVGLGIIAGYYQYYKLLELSMAIRSCNKKIVYVLGGHGPSPEPEYFLRITNADYVVHGEGELSFLELVNYLSGNSDRSIDEIEGISYLKEGLFHRNKERDVIENVDSIPFPDWGSFPMENYVLVREFGFSKTDRVMCMVSGRGCPFKCTFCYQYDNIFRPRSPESIVEEIKELKTRYGVTAIEFLDDLLMSSKNRTISICEAILKSDLNIKWECSGRLNYADIEILDLMKKSGCTYINYGVEALDNDVLSKMRKNLTVDQIHRGIENTLKVGIAPGINIIWGNIGDTVDTLNKAVSFIKSHTIGVMLRTIRPVTPYPGSALYYYAIKMGYLSGVRDFYENKHVNSDLLSVNFTDLSDGEFYAALRDANICLINDHYEKSRQKCVAQARDLYDNRNASFRGFRQM